MARAMEHQAALLLRRLCLHESHAWPDHGTADRLSSMARNAPPLRPEEFAPPHLYAELSGGRIVRRRKALGKAGFSLTSVNVHETSSAGPNMRFVETKTPEQQRTCTIGSRQRAPWPTSRSAYDARPRSRCSCCSAPTADRLPNGQAPPDLQPRRSLTDRDDTRSREPEAESHVVLSNKWCGDATPRRWYYLFSHLLWNRNPSAYPPSITCAIDRLFVWLAHAGKNAA